MYGKYKKRSSRAGFQKIKLICSINITQLVIANSSSVPPGSVLSICFEKGGKISTSNEIIFDTNKNSINPLRSNVNLKYVTIPIDERVELVMTMYKDVTTNNFQEKVAKLILRQLKRHSGLGMDAFKGIGVCELQLHDLVQEVATSRTATKECTLQLENLPGCSMSALINIKFLKSRPSIFGMRNSIGGVSTGGNVGEDGDSADDGEDNISVGSTVSGGSAFSTLGATFYYNDLEEYYGAGEGIVGLSGAVQTGISDSYSFGRQRSGDSDTEPTESNVGSVAGAQRRRSGVHVVEAAHQAERKPIKPLSRRSSNIGATSRSGNLFGSQSSLVDANQSDPDFMDTARSPTSSPTPETYSPPPAPVTVSRGSRTPSVAIPGRSETEAWTDEAGNRAEWESVTTTERDRMSLHGSPVKHSSPKSLRSRKTSNASVASSPGGHNGHSLLAALTSANNTTNTTHTTHPVSQAQQATSIPAHTSYNNQETFALLEKELQLRGERIALLEARLDTQEQEHRAELLAVRSELNAAQAEVRILSAVPPPVPLTSPLVELVVLSEVLPLTHIVETAEASKPHDQAVVMPFLCTRCKRLEETLPQTEEEEELRVTVSVEDVLSTPIETLPEMSEVVTVEVPLPPVKSAVVVTEKTEILHEDQNSDVSVAHSVDSTAPSVELVTKESNEASEQSEAAVSIDVSVETAPDSTTCDVIEAMQHRVPITVSVATETDPIALNSEPVVAQVPATSAPHSVPTTTKVAIETACASTETDLPSLDPPRNDQAITALLSEYGRSSAQVQLLASDLVYYKQLAEEALQAKAEETLASREAATVAVQACMRRADCEQELEESIYQLRELQRKHSRLTIEYEAEVRRNYSLKARIQLYAQKLSAMEVDYTLSLEEATDTTEGV